MQTSSNISSIFTTKTQRKWTSSIKNPYWTLPEFHLNSQCTWFLLPRCTSMDYCQIVTFLNLNITTQKATTWQHTTIWELLQSTTKIKRHIICLGFSSISNLYPINCCRAIFKQKMRRLQMSCFFWSLSNNRICIMPNLTYLWVLL